MFADAEESAVDDFAFVLFQELGYTPVGRVIRTRKDIPLVICGEQRHAKTDLVAEAIAAFHSNNLTRTQALGLPALASKVADIPTHPPSSMRISPPSLDLPVAGMKAMLHLPVRAHE
ncbi:hypothetical protein B0H14DRAFT_2638922 [Mycena olivaceomarginata]|nr:hypothetical protein B0H14DRAFT_2638922 [Mycena olivaceomarginata]